MSVLTEGRFLNLGRVEEKTILAERSSIMNKRRMGMLFWFVCFCFLSSLIWTAGPVLAQKEKKEILNKLLFRIRAVKSAKENKYILLNAHESSVPAICKILPGMKSPTILPLAEKGWCSLHSVVKEDEFWERIDQLKTAGAEGILVIPIEKMIM